MILIWHPSNIQGAWKLQDAAIFVSVDNLFECVCVCVTNMSSVRLGPPLCARVQIPVKFTFVDQKKFYILVCVTSLYNISYQLKKITVVIRFVTRAINNYIVCNIKPYILQQVLRQTLDIDSDKYTKKKI